MKRSTVKSRHGVYARWLGGKGIYRWRSKTPMQPASCIKILSTGTALREMGRSFRFETSFYGKYKGNIMTTPLFWKGSGDPSFSVDDLRSVVLKLKRLGIQSIPGGITIDNYAFSRRRTTGFEWKHGTEGYLTAPNAVSVEGNSVGIDIFLKDGKPTVECQVKSPFLKCINKLKTGKKTKKVRAYSRLQDKYLEVVVLGRVGKNHKKKIHERVRTFKPEMFTAGVLIQLLKDNGIKVPDQFRRGKVPKDTPLLAVHKSKPLFELVKSTNKFSNNFWAENILRALGRYKSGKAGSTWLGLKRVRSMMTRSGIKSSRYVISNGSGLFGKSSISPYSLVSVLQRYSTLSWLHRDIVDSMARPGRDGTLHSRLTTSLTWDILYAKTGTLRTASCLSGYLIHKNRTIIFSVMNDKLKDSARHARKFQDEVVKTLAKLIKGLKISTKPPVI